MANRGDHPRIRGEHDSFNGRLRHAVGIIPAYAGNTRAVVHPPTALVGSSPHTRGTPARTPRACMSSRDHPRIRGEHFKLAVAIQQREGIIPAYAGNTWWLVPAPFTNWGSSPHTRGTLISQTLEQGKAADHPRIRGEHPFKEERMIEDEGIIPAYAGNTATATVCLHADQGSSPHTRGTLSYAGDVSSAASGSSPHTRGTLINVSLPMW